MSFDQEVTEYVAGRHIRMLNLTHGVLWDSTFSITENDGASSLTLSMRSVTRNPLKRVMMRLIAPMVQRALDKDVEATKAYAEKAADREGDSDAS